MKLISANLSLLFLITAGFFTPALLRAADEPSAAEAEKAETPAKEVSAAPQEEEDEVDPEQEAREKAQAKRYQKSRLTSDQTESTADRRELILTPGEDRIVDFTFEGGVNATGISIGNPKVVATTLVKIGEKRQMVFKPLSTGDSTITVRDTEGTLRLIFDVRVASSNLSRVSKELESLLRDIEGIKIHIVGKKIVIDGEVIVPLDYGRLVSVISDKAYSEFVLNLAQLSPLALQFLSKRIQEDSTAFAPNVRTRVVNGMIWLEGTVDTKDQADRALNLAKLYLPEAKPPSYLDREDFPKLGVRSLVQSFLVINAPPPKKQDKLVRVTVHFVELSKDYRNVFGFKWAPGFTTDPQITVGSGEQGGGQAATTSFTATLSSLFPRLQSAQDAGFARILRTGNITVRSGQQASMNDTVEIPYATTGANGLTSTSLARTGLNILVTPSILGSSEDIQLAVEMSQSNLVGRTVANTPITAQHAVKTQLYVKSSESAAIAGVNAADVQTNFNKDDPNSGSFGGGQTQPLFNLMRSKSFTKKKGQFVVFVTPQIIENASDGSEDLKKNFRVKVR